VRFKTPRYLPSLGYLIKLSVGFGHEDGDRLLESFRDRAPNMSRVLDTARATKFPLPLASTAHQMFMQASSAGHGREDDSAVIKIFPGIELPGGTKG